MCIIIDASVFGVYCKSKGNMGPVRKWVESGKGKVVYSPTGKVQEEWNKFGPMRDKIDVYREMGVFDLASVPEVQTLTNTLQKSGTLRSNDPHMIALAKVSGAKLLVSDDNKLLHDFETLIENGKIYSSNTSPSVIQNHQCLSK